MIRDGENREREETLLPIGSVVRFKNWEQLVMIYGRKQMDSKTKEEWDYVACYYPIGNISTEYNLFLIMNMYQKSFLLDISMMRKLS